MPEPRGMDPGRSPASGFSLIELLVSLGIMTVLALMGATLMVRTTSFSTESILRSDLMESAKMTQERLFDQLCSARLVSLLGGPASQPVLTYLVPLELPVGAGPAVDYLNSEGEVNWGAIEATGPMLDRPGAPHQITAGVAATGTVRESDIRLDLNHDRDQADTMELGSLVLRTTGGQETSLATRRLVLGGAGNAPLDIDGDGTVDPLFQLAGETFTDSNRNGLHDEGEGFVDQNGNQRWDGVLRLNLLVVAMDRAGRGHRIVYRTSLKLSNQ